MDDVSFKCNKTYDVFSLTLAESEIKGVFVFNLKEPLGEVEGVAQAGGGGGATSDVCSWLEAMLDVQCREINEALGSVGYLACSKI